MDDARRNGRCGRPTKFLSEGGWGANAELSRYSTSPLNFAAALGNLDHYGDDVRVVCGMARRDSGEACGESEWGGGY
jgi:hypothetical protein